MATLASGLDDIINDEEGLARFLTSSRQFNATMVRPAAFLPQDGETSVFRHGSEPAAVLWQLARDHSVGGRTLHGAALLKARHVRAARLDAVSSEPPPRHAIIIGWALSATDPDMERAERMEQALLLARNADFVLFDPGAEP